MDNKFDRLEAKLDSMDSKLDKVEVVLAQNTQILDEHQRRSIALEQYVEKLETHLTSEIAPVKMHVERITWAVKGILWFLSASAAVIITLKKLSLI